MKYPQYIFEINRKATALFSDVCSFKFDKEMMDLVKARTMGPCEFQSFE